jgi:hypothetical protein
MREGVCVPCAVTCVPCAVQRLFLALCAEPGGYCTDKQLLDTSSTKRCTALVTTHAGQPGVSICIWLVFLRCGLLLAADLFAQRR